MQICHISLQFFCKTVMSSLYVRSCDYTTAQNLACINIQQPTPVELLARHLYWQNCSPHPPLISSKPRKIATNFHRKSSYIMWDGKFLLHGLLWGCLGNFTKMPFLDCSFPKHLSEQLSYWYTKLHWGHSTYIWI